MPRLAYPVDYRRLDTFKRKARQLGRDTAGNLTRFGFSEMFPDGNESAHVIDRGPSYDVLLLECLGTRMLVADAWYKLTGVSRYKNMGWSMVAAAANDLTPYGAAPFAAQMFFAVGDARWFDDEQRSDDLLQGWKEGWMTAGAAWRQGETPELQGMVVPDTGIIAGAVQGIVKPRERLIRGNLAQEDAIVLLSSSGIHDNGLTLTRLLADYKDGLLRKLGHVLCPWLVDSHALPRGYLTPIGRNERAFGDVLLDATTIYSPFMQECLDHGIEIHYAVNITGHGWQKLMRHPNSFVYVIERIFEPSALFRFIQEHAGLTDEEMYRIFNMDAGYALYVPGGEVGLIHTIAARHGIKTLHAGHVERRGNEKKVIIRPLGIEL